VEGCQVKTSQWTGAKFTMFSGSGVLLLHFQINDAVFMLVVLKHVVLFIFFIFLLKTKYQDSIKKEYVEA
jgi:hypothetical protein